MDALKGNLRRDTREEGRQRDILDSPPLLLLSGDRAGEGCTVLRGEAWGETNSNGDAARAQDK